MGDSPIYKLRRVKPQSSNNLADNKRTMDSLERFQCLITRQNNKLDRIPLDYWATKEIDQRLCNFYNCHDKASLLDKLDVDFRYIEGPKYIGPPLEVHSDGSENDIWGVPRKRIWFGEGEFRGSYEAVTKSPLEKACTVQEVEGYPLWPDPNWYDYSVIEAQCDQVHQKKRVALFMGDRLNRIAQLKPMMYVRGVERTLADLAKRESPIFNAIIRHFVDFYKEYLIRILKAAHGKIDIIVTGDDFGHQGGLLCSPRVWRSKLLPGFAEYLQIAKEFKTKTMHHTCGSVRPIIGDMVAAGLDILNPVQPDTAQMDHLDLKKEWGDKLIFHGGMGLQGTLRFGEPKDVAEEVNKCCKGLG